MPNDLNAAEQKIIDVEVRTAAVAAGAIDPDIAIAVSREFISIDKDFNVHGVNAAVDELKENKPHLFKQAVAAETESEKPKQTEKRYIQMTLSEKRAWRVSQGLSAEEPPIGSREWQQEVENLKLTGSRTVNRNSIVPSKIYAPNPNPPDFSKLKVGSQEWVKATQDYIRR